MTSVKQNEELLRWQKIGIAVQQRAKEEYFRISRMTFKSSEYDMHLRGVNQPPFIYSLSSSIETRERILWVLSRYGDREDQIDRMPDGTAMK